MQQLTIEEYIQYMGNETNWKIEDFIEIFNKHPNTTHLKSPGKMTENQDGTFNIEEINIMRPNNANNQTS